jgi:hypothetical protein
VPLKVTINYIGVKSNHAASGIADVYLLLVVTDGYQKAVSRFLPATGTFKLDDYQTIGLNQTVFDTDSAGDSLKVCILAYKQSDPSWLPSILMPALAEIERGLDWGNYRSAQEILTTVDKYKKKSTTSFASGGDSLIGYYEEVWAANESFGIGQYSGVGSDDFRLWFSVWSKEQPEPPPQPILLPDVALDKVNMLSTVSAGQARIDIITIKNKEQHPVTVTLKGTSSMTGDFYSSTIEVPADGFALAESNVVIDSPAFITISYALYFRSTKLDSWSGELNVTPFRRITLAEWRNFNASRIIDRTFDGTEVILYVEASGYDGVTLAASIRRVEPDGSYSYETTVEVTMVGGRGIGSWTAKWQPVTGGDPTRYVFGVMDVYSNELTVVK